jgi:hypothetical protein
MKMKWQDKLVISFYLFAIGAGVSSILIFFPAIRAKIGTIIIIIGIVIAIKEIERFSSFSIDSCSRGVCDDS